MPMACSLTHKLVNWRVQVRVKALTADLGVIYSSCDRTALHNSHTYFFLATVPATVLVKGPP